MCSLRLQQQQQQQQQQQKTTELVRTERTSEENPQSKRERPKQESGNNVRSNSRQNAEAAPVKV